MALSDDFDEQVGRRIEDNWDNLDASAKLSSSLAGILGRGIWSVGAVVCRGN